jgi:predicted phage terminase large subunit-like protein
LTSVAELLDYLTEDERAELDGHVAALADPVGTTKSFKQFVTETNRRYRWYHHCEVLAKELQRIADGENDRLLVFMPPRHGKTEQVSRRFPAYFLRRHPSKWVGLASYEATLAQDFSRSSRDAFTMDGGELRGDSKAVDLWQTTQGGGMWAAGVGGPLTGKGGHCLIIDDPIKNDEEAASETIRAKHQSWYDATFSTRLEPGGAIVVVQTRWNEADLSGYILAKEALEPEGWTILNLAAIAEPETPNFPESCHVVPDWRREGQALCPERYDEEALRKIKTRVGSYFWSALYQQRPTPPEGGTFKRSWFKYHCSHDLLGEGVEFEDAVPTPLSFSFICLSFDMSFKDEQTSDFVVGQVWGVNGPNAYLLDQVRDRMDFPTALKAVRAMQAKWKQANVTLVEDKANGSAIISTLKQKVAGIVAVEPLGGKVSRANAEAPLVESGNVYIPDPAMASWVGDFVEEYAAFPNGVNDDQVDAGTQALAKLSPMMRAVQAPPTEEEREAVRSKVRDHAPSYDFQKRKLLRPVDRGEREVKPSRFTRPVRAR